LASASLPTADVVNAYMSVLIEGVAETMELADRMGIGHPQLAEVIEGGPLDAPIADAKFHKMDRSDYAAEFPLEWALKDVDLVLGAAGGANLPVLAALSRQWHAAENFPRICCPHDRFWESSRPETPGTAARTSAPPAWPWARGGLEDMVSVRWLPRRRGCCRR
jgi:NAD-binding of NADP-dependent 3-hydroxyisobutyrate dehydrogenase